MSSYFDDVRITGVGTTNFGADYPVRNIQRCAYDLGVQAMSAALDECGLEKSQIDSLICVRLPSYNQLAVYAGLPSLKSAYSLEGTGRMSGYALHQAACMIASGQSKAVAIVYGNNGRSVGDRYGGKFDNTSITAFDAMYGMTSPGAYVAMMYGRHMYEYGTPTEALATLAINNRRNAILNPVAVFKKPLTAEEYAAAPYIAEPLRKYDYCLINDGGVCIILTHRSLATGLKKKSVRLLASANAADLRPQYTATDYYYNTSRNVAQSLYEQAGLTPSDMDCVQIYDNFTPTILFSLEGFGFCERGQAGQWVLGGRIELGGELPINTSGGHTAEGYMQGFALQAEAIRQARGECGDRQVHSYRYTQYICVSPLVNSQIFTAAD